jgi:hypothetical protein
MLYSPGVPRRTEWTLHLERAIADLDALTTPTLDRQAIQALLRVSPRQALRILHRLDGHQAGQALVIGREELKGKLQQMAAGGPIQFERARRGRIVEELARIGTERKARQTVIPAAPIAGADSLPAAIRLKQGRLEIAFTSGEELLGLLLELAHFVADDPERFRRLAPSGETL